MDTSLLGGTLVSPRGDTYTTRSARNPPFSCATILDEREWYHLHKVKNGGEKSAVVSTGSQWVCKASYRNGLCHSGQKKKGKEHSAEGDEHLITARTHYVNFSHTHLFAFALHMVWKWIGLSLKRVTIYTAAAIIFNLCDGAVNIAGPPALCAQLR